MRANALAAAFEDPRFPPLSRHEWPAITLEVSLLSPPEPLTFTDETALIAQLQADNAALTAKIDAARAAAQAAKDADAATVDGQAVLDALA